MKSWYAIRSESRTKISKPVLYCMSDNGGFGDDPIAVALCLKAHLRESRVAMSVHHGYRWRVWLVL